MHRAGKTAASESAQGVAIRVARYAGRAMVVTNYHIRGGGSQVGTTPRGIFMRIRPLGTVALCVATLMFVSVRLASGQG